jgi:hypothetical protein
LQWLSLKNNRIGNQYIGQLLTSVRENSVLTYINIELNKVHYKMQDSIAGAVVKNAEHKKKEQSQSIMVRYSHIKKELSAAKSAAHSQSVLENLNFKHIKSSKENIIKTIIRKQNTNAQNLELEKENLNIQSERLSKEIGEVEQTTENNEKIYESDLVEYNSRVTEIVDESALLQNKVNNLLQVRSCKEMQHKEQISHLKKCLTNLTGQLSNLEMITQGKAKLIETLRKSVSPQKKCMAGYTPKVAL